MNVEEVLNASTGKLIACQRNEKLGTSAEQKQPQLPPIPKSNRLVAHNENQQPSPVIRKSRKQGTNIAFMC